MVWILPKILDHDVVDLAKRSCIPGKFGNFHYFH
jgi:hypothetical protein